MDTTTSPSYADVKTAFALLTNFPEITLMVEGGCQHLNPGDLMLAVALWGRIEGVDKVKGRRSPLPVQAAH